MLPSLLPVVTPVAVYAIVRLVEGRAAAFTTLGALLLGTIATGLFFALSMTSFWSMEPYNRALH